MADLYRLKSGKVYRRETIDGEVQEVCKRTGDEFVPSPEELAANKFRMEFITSISDNEATAKDAALNGNETKQSPSISKQAAKQEAQVDIFKQIADAKSLDELKVMQVAEAKRTTPRKRVLQAIGIRIQEFTAAAAVAAETAVIQQQS